jgi:hypothetical protein
MYVDQVCQICCTADLIQLSATKVAPRLLPLKLYACKSCGLLHFLPEVTTIRTPFIERQRRMNSVGQDKLSIAL